MTDNLEHEFFTKVKGWNFVATRGHPWHSPGGGRYFELPPISTSWDAFHEWVVPELVDPSNLLMPEEAFFRLGKFYYEDEGPLYAMEWAMEELQS